MYAFLYFEYTLCNNDEILQYYHVCIQLIMVWELINLDIVIKFFSYAFLPGTSFGYANKRKCPLVQSGLVVTYNWHKKTEAIAESMVLLKLHVLILGYTKVMILTFCWMVLAKVLKLSLSGSERFLFHFTPLRRTVKFTGTT